MTRDRTLARALLHAALAGEWEVRAIEARLQEAVPLGRWGSLSWRFAKGAQPLELSDALIEWLRKLASVRTAVRNGATVRRWFIEPSRMQLGPWPVPPLAAVGDVAAALDLSIDDLSWFADAKGLERHAIAPALWHYHYHWVAKSSGGARLVEAPKGRTREVQRWLLRNVLDLIPAHEAAHGFRRGRSTLTCAAPHVGQAVVMSLDLEDFFASVPQAAIVGVFRTAGYPSPVAVTLAGLCCTRVPRTVRLAVPTGGDPPAKWRQGQRLAAPHLPTGAPTSPALANLAAYRLDCRLSAAAAAVGAAYTRYADDLTFSGDTGFSQRATRFAAFVDTIAREEGYRVNMRKTRIAGRGSRQQVVGVVVNDRPALPRARYDALRAVLHNCIAKGPSTQNRAAHPDFQAWVVGSVAAARAVDPKRGGHLAAMLERVDWSR